jgi:hypothetical protein
MDDEVITCIQCEKDFIFSADEQDRYQRMNFDEPKRCPTCRKNRTRIAERGTEHYRNKKKYYRFKNQQSGG